MGETITPQPMDVAEELLPYDELTTCAYLANAKSGEGTALRLLLLNWRRK
jgi:hypothetical protein